MTDPFQDMQLTLVDEEGNELIVTESLTFPDSLTGGMSLVHFEYKTLGGEIVQCDHGDFVYRGRHYTTKSVAWK